MLLIETIKIKNRALHHLAFHQKRMNESHRIFFPASEKINLKQSIILPQDLMEGAYKCRVLYSQKIEKIEFIPYQIRPIRSLKTVYANDINYGFKYADRSILCNLYENRGDSDDILIIKNGFVTDTSYCNIVFWDGQKWWTPNTPLLKGTKRTKLLEEGIIFEKTIRRENIKSYIGAKVINAMMDLEDGFLIKTIN